MNNIVMKPVFRTIALTSLLIPVILIPQSPRLTIVFVVDQLANHFFMKHSSFFKGAFKQLLRNGIVYEQAYFPHGMPATATGHAALSTGTYAHNHGITGNYWYDSTGNKKIKAYDDSSKNAPPFLPEGMTADQGYSAKHLVVDGVSDQYMLEHKDHAVYSFSLKTRAAIGMGNHLGKNIWFETKTGCMTSSKAFFDKLPGWLIQFNATHSIALQHPISWHLMYNPASKQYQYKHAQDDRFCSLSIHTQNQHIALTPKAGEPAKEYAKPYHWFELLPAANQYVLDCAYAGIEHELPRHQHMLVWISLSSIDKLGHLVGCYNIALIDMLYHLDMQLKAFMKAINKLVPHKESVAYVLTGDHGVMPIPELLAADGYPAKRLDSNALVTSLNASIQEAYGIENLIKAYKSPQFFFDEPRFAALPSDTQHAIVKTVMAQLKQLPGIRHTWTFDELNHATYPSHSFEEHFKQQLYEGRSGRITLQTDPYILLTDYPLGTGHKTPYGYDTQVPLIIYCKHMLEKKRIVSLVWTPQLAATLANILEVPRPSAATFGMLPEIAKT